MRLQINRTSKIVLFLVAACLISMVLFSLFQEQFDASNWKAEPTMRYKMADDILEQKLLIGKTKEEIVVLLGVPNSSSTADNQLFFYELGTPPSFFQSKKELLVIVFENRKAVKVSIATE